MPWWSGDWLRRLPIRRARTSAVEPARLASDPGRRRTLRWAAGIVAALAVGTAVDTATAHNPTWAADTINAAHTLGLTPYRAVPFRRERLLPYPAVTVDDPNLPVGMHQIRQPGLTGTMMETGIALYRTPVPRATPLPSRTRAATSAAPSSSVSAAAPRGAAAAAASSTRSLAVKPPSSPPAAPAPAPAEVKVLSSTVVAQPHEAIIVVGTSTACVPANGYCYHFSHVLNMTATAYDATWASNGPWTGQRSAIGLPLNYGIVAVDPRVVPLGSRLYVEHYGLAIAADTGSAIVGDRIDLFFWDTPQDIAAFGIQHLKVYILDDPRLKPIPVPPAIRRTLG